MAFRVGVDTGGTFTDLVAMDEGGLRVTKTLSTPTHPMQSTQRALDEAGIAAAGGIDTLIHSTTIATNALIERRGAVVGLITTAGFGDVLQIQRMNRPRSFDLSWSRPEALVPRHLVREVRERVLYDGSVLEPLDEAAVVRAAGELLELGAEALAISFLFSFLNNDHERRAQELLTQKWPELAVSASADVFGQWREYERTSSCAVDVFLKPIVGQYASDLTELARSRKIGNVYVMRSNGGAMTTDGARTQPISVVRSGPAGGAVASAFLGRLIGLENLIIADMGGTSFDTGLVYGGAPEFTDQAELEWGIPLCTPMVDVRSVGAGGGSVAWLDPAGILKVGPISAGADPGPACYGRGGARPTVTDANVVVGRLAAESPLAGGLELDAEAAKAAVDSLASEMGRETEEVALGILRIADATMAQALRLVSVDRGRDPRDFTLIAFGGAGPLHACELARALAITTVLVPPLPGAFAALGALMADTRFDYQSTFVTAGGASALDMLNQIFERLESRAESDLEREGVKSGAVWSRSVEMRYAGQNWELEIPINGRPSAETMAETSEQFHAAHEQQFGWSVPNSELEFVNFKLTVSASRPRPRFPELGTGDSAMPVATRAVRFSSDNQRVPTPVFRRDEMPAGFEVYGPAIVVEDVATTLLLPNDRLTVHPSGALIIDIDRKAAV